MPGNATPRRRRSCADEHAKQASIVCIVLGGLRADNEGADINGDCATAPRAHDHRMFNDINLLKPRLLL